MGRGVAFTHSEDDFLITNAKVRTASEIFEIHNAVRSDMIWPQRSKKSLARRIERLRGRARVGLRDDLTRRKAYYGRHSKET